MTHSKKKIVIISLIVMLIAGIVFLMYNVCYMKKTIAYGISIDGIKLGGMSKTEAYAALKGKAKKIEKNEKITAVYKAKKIIFDSGEIKPEPAVASSVNYAYKIGKSGTLGNRLYELVSTFINKNDMGFTITVDNEALEKIMEPLNSIITDPAQPAIYSLEGNEIVITPGKEGNSPDYSLLCRNIADILYGRDKGQIKISLVRARPQTLSAVKIYDMFHTSVKNADFVKEANGKIVVSQESAGLDFDAQKAQEIIDKADGKECRIPVNFIAPSVKASDLTTKMYTNELSSYKSSYSTGNSGRNINLELACSKFNGIELLPGETFSYIGAIGRGTYEEGYVDAPIYSDGEVATGVAGGICQGSSTLYSAVLYADLKIIQRVNHTMPVGYVPHGMDATIANPNIDFQFANSSTFPVKILANCQNGVVDIRIIGTVTVPGKTIEIKNKVVSTTPFGTKVIERDDIAPGEEHIKQNGSDGSVIETYKIIKLNGVEQSNTLISTSRYDPIPKIIETGRSAASTFEEEKEVKEKEKDKH